MPSRVVQRSAAIAACLSLLVSTTVFADVVGADAVGPEVTFVDLGQASPGGQKSFDVDFLLTCRNGSHPARGSTIQVLLGSAIVPQDGAVDVEPGAIGPIPDDWPQTPEVCSGSPTLRSSTPATVTITAPTAVQDDYLFTLVFSRSPSTGITGSTAVSVQLDVVGNTPPVLDVPDSFTVEGDSPGGWTADFDVVASDAEDDPDPTPVCTPPIGEVLGVGTTTVTCTVVDRGGLRASGSFDVTVEDTTAPTISGMPGDRTVTTAASGATVSWPAPTATDVVDAAPAVGCSPASGSSFPVGSTTVTCTATDDAGNTRSASFTVTVVRAHAIFEQPVGNARSITVSSSRTIPIKVQLHHDATPVTGGDAWVWVGSCGAAQARVAQLDWQGGRWQTHLDTSSLGAGCHQVTVRANGMTFGGFELRVDGSASVAAKAKDKG